MTDVQTLEGLTSGTYKIVTESGTVLYVNLGMREAIRLPGAEATTPGFLSVMFDGGDARVMTNFDFDYNVEVGAMMFAHYDPTPAMTGLYRSTPVRAITEIIAPVLQARTQGH